MNGDYIVWALTALNLCSSLVYASQGDLNRGIYWFGAFLLTGSTIFMGK